MISSPFLHIFQHGGHGHSHGGGGDEGHGHSHGGGGEGHGHSHDSGHHGHSHGGHSHSKEVGNSQIMQVLAFSFRVPLLEMRLDIIFTTVVDPDPGSGALLTPGSWMGKKSRSGSGMNIPYHILRA